MRKLVILCAMAFATVISVRAWAQSPALPPPPKTHWTFFTQQVQSSVYFGLADTRGLTKEQEAIKEAAIAKQITPVCMKTDAEGESEALRAASAAPGTDLWEILDELSRRYWLLDHAMGVCLSRFGAVGFPSVTTADGTNYRRAEYMAAAASAFRREALARKSDAEMPMWLSAVGAGLVSVRGHVRKDGAFVPPHLRSRPNGTCLDNLRGCR